jgi:hypothetical protein
MKTFAVIKDGLVDNKIICESKELAESLTGLLCVEIENSLVCEIDSLYVDGNFIGNAPYPSWTYNNELEEWVPPVAKPEDENHYTWSEEDLNWEIITE